MKNENGENDSSSSSSDLKRQRMAKRWRTRASKWQGYLYKCYNGKQIPANSTERGVYWLQLRINGKRCRIPLKDEQGNRIRSLQEAERIRQKIIAPLLLQQREQIVTFILQQLNAERELLALNANKNANKNAKDVLIKDMVDNYLNYKLQNSDNYTAQMKGTLSRLCKYLNTNFSQLKYISEIPTKAIQSYLDSNGTVTASYYNTQAKNIRAAFILLMKDYTEANVGWKNPVLGINYRIVTANNRFSKLCLTNDQVAALLKSAEEKDIIWKILFTIGAYTGLRLGDCATLKWKEVDLEKKIITKIAHKNLKYAQKPLIVGIHAELEKVLLAQKDRNIRSDFVIPELSDYTSNHATCSRVKKAVRKIFNNAGIKTTASNEGMGKIDRKLYGFHSFRHTYISRLISLGVPLAVVQESVGHSRAAQTEHYTQIQQKNVIEAIKILNFTNDNT